MGGLRDLLRILVKGRPDGLRRTLLRRLFGRTGASSGSASTPTAPAEPLVSGKVLAKVAELADGDVLEVMVDGAPVALCRVGDAYYAVDGTCPHAGGPLGDGELDGTTLTCPYHGWAFDVTDGSCLMDDELTVARLPVRVEAGRVILEEPP